MRPTRDEDDRLVVDGPQNKLGDVVRNFRFGEPDQPDVRHVKVKKCFLDNSIGTWDQYNFVLQVNDNPLRLVNLQGEIEHQDYMASKHFQNPRCDACGAKCTLLYQCRAYRKRTLGSDGYDNEKDRAIMTEQEANVNWDRRKVRKLAKEIIYLGPDCGQKLLGAPGVKTSRSGKNEREGNEDGGAGPNTTARSASSYEVKDLLTDAKSIVSREQQRQAAERVLNADKCEESIRVAVEAAEKVRELAGLAKKRRFEGERFLAQLKNQHFDDARIAADESLHTRSDLATMIEQAFYIVCIDGRILRKEIDRFTNAYDTAQNTAVLSRDDRLMQRVDHELPSLNATRNAFIDATAAGEILQELKNHRLTRFYSEGWFERHYT
jgi:hypothetical protein